MRREAAVREEMASINDLAYLSLIEDECPGPNRDWAAAAEERSVFLSSAGSVGGREDEIRNWVADIEDVEIDTTSIAMHKRRNQETWSTVGSPPAKRRRTGRLDAPPVGQFLSIVLCPLLASD